MYNVLIIMGIYSSYDFYFFLGEANFPTLILRYLS